MIGTLLVRLATHYHRPDFGPAQVKLMVLDFLEDLADYTVAEIETAVRDYRRDTERKFFPRPADIRELCKEIRKDRAEQVRGEGRSMLPEFGESRPAMWWGRGKRFWQPHWREDEIPEEHRATFAAIKAKQA